MRWTYCVSIQIFFLSNLLSANFFFRRNHVKKQANQFWMNHLLNVDHTCSKEEKNWNRMSVFFPLNLNKQRVFYSTKWNSPNELKWIDFFLLSNVKAMFGLLKKFQNTSDSYFKLISYLRFIVLLFSTILFYKFVRISPFFLRFTYSESYLCHLSTCTVSVAFYEKISNRLEIR